MSEWPFIASATEADVARVRALSPLAADLTMRCGPFHVPVAVVASVATLEQEDSEAADVARAFVADDPWAGMGSVHPGGWLLLGQDDDTIVIGQREGEVGLGHVVVLERRHGAFTARSMGGWRLSSSDAREEVASWSSASVDGAAVAVDWECGQDMSGVPHLVVSRWDVLETNQDVHLILWSLPNPARAQATSAGSWEFGTGASGVAAVELSRPLGQRALFDDSRVPAVLVRVSRLDPHGPDEPAG